MAASCLYSIFLMCLCFFLLQKNVLLRLCTADSLSCSYLSVCMCVLQSMCGVMQKLNTFDRITVLRAVCAGPVVVWLVVVSLSLSLPKTLIFSILLLRTSRLDNGQFITSNFLRQKSFCFFVIDAPKNDAARDTRQTVR